MDGESLPALLRLARARRQHSQLDAADYMGVSRQTLGAWEAGRAFPSVMRSRDVARYCSVEVDAIEAARGSADA